ncbi:MAG: ornithine cyclodeaminase family protein, partial [Candidatus Eremiobacteraeota bacterium]|nr:ornithine cyclodeaminase family protein [Candidatus Eremiobacteraeota bacterium]
MNPLYLTEEDVAATLTIPDALRLVEDAARALAEGRAQNRPRQRAQTAGTANGCVVQVLAAAYGDRLGHKTYTVAPHGRGARFWYTLFANSGEMLAVIEADTLGQRRTGAASGVAAKHLAREDASTLAVIGTGWQARSQLEACCAVRPIRSVRAYGRDEARRRAFCDEMTANVGIAVEPCES